ncbi:MAG: PEGA domain-containing protein [Myxococcales bacterium]|nr:PEGA domain-containing protein [Myxococcales bacterium]MDP3506087.1 PEGA domain-containing protein [Myxococcales bacterium]
MRGILLLSMCLGCTSSTIINSRPDRAMVTVDGQNLGEAPAQWSDTVWAGTKNSVRLSMPGYRDTNAIISADQWSVGRVIISILCFLPGLLWSTDYRPSYEFALQPESGGYQAPGSYPPPPGYYAPPPPGYAPQPAPPPIPQRAQPL